jgi:hypothetical protein
MRSRKRWWRRLGLRVALVIVLILATGFLQNMAQNDSPSPKRDINAVLRDHDRELLLIPGVVGVYVALLEDGKTPCLKVMLARKTPETEHSIPRRIEGYPVVTEVTGEIRPLGHDK